MKEEVAQHCVRLLDARDTLRGHYDRDYQLRAMGYFILVAKFHNRIQVKVIIDDYFKRKIIFSSRLA